MILFRYISDTVTRMAEIAETDIEHLRVLLRQSVADAHADGILLSGGLDTSVLAAFASQRGPLMAVTVCVRPDQSVDATHRGALADKLGIPVDQFPSPDARYARQCAEILGLTHETCWVTLDELLAFAPGTIRAIRSFDPMQVRNGLTIFCGLQRAKALGLGRVLTGDGADEMYAGYSHMWTMPPAQLVLYLKHMATIMNFTTPALARAVELEVVSPFTEPALVEFAQHLPHEALIGEFEGRLMGKWIVRQAVRDLLPPELVWRVKTPIEYGSGSTFLRPLLEGRISDAEFSENQNEYDRRGLRLREKEQLYYYRIFERIFGAVSMDGSGQDGCPFCGTAITPANRNYCGVCGAWGFQNKENH